MPAIGVAQYERLAEDIEARGARCQAFRPIGPIGTASQTCRTERETTPHDLARLRKQATAEIDRLLAFLDVSDPYVSTELEDDISSDLEDGNDDELALTGICRPLGGL